MTLSVASGALTGLFFAAGVLLVWSFVSRRRFSLVERVEPYLVEVSESGRFLGPLRITSPLGVWGRALDPFAKKFDVVLATFSSPERELRERLRRAGRALSPQEYRLEQLQWAVGGLVAGVAATVIVSVTRSFEPVVAVAAVILAPLIALVLCDLRLNSAITARRENILTEFPTIAELLALSVSAGEGPLAALERVSRVGVGALAHELSDVVADVRAGAPLTKALEDLGTRTQAAAIVRFADGVAIAVERGTPLAQVLRSQAQDARDLGHRELMELGGKKEIAMLIPVIFFILPITIIFAIYPSLSMLTLGN